MEKGFNENAVDNFIQEYKNTISFAKLENGDRLRQDDEDSQDNGSQNPTQNKPMISTSQPQLKTQVNQDSFTLSTGVAYIIAPANMTKDDRDILFDYLEVWKKKMSRGQNDQEIK